MIKARPLVYVHPPECTCTKTTHYTKK